MALTRKYDPIFLAEGRGIPVPYLRALSHGESRLNPKSQDGSYWGLMQVGWRGKNAVLKGYNQRNKTRYTKQDLLNPTINIRIGADALRRHIKSYLRFRGKNLREDWTNPEFIKLVTAGWNSGWSRARLKNHKPNTGGVGRVAWWLNKQRLPVTHDNVFKYAKAASATWALRGDLKRGREKQLWQRAVMRRFFKQRDVAGRVPAPAPAPPRVEIDRKLIAVDIQRRPAPAGNVAAAFFLLSVTIPIAIKAGNP